MQVLTPPLVKPNTAPFVQSLEDGTEFHCDLPIDSHFNDGTGVIFYINKGFVPLDQFKAEKHAKKVEAERQAEAAKAEAEKAEAEKTKKPAKSEVVAK